VKLDEFSPLKFQEWLREETGAPKTKGHLKAFVNRMFKKAKLYGMVEFVENPIDLVEVRGISKRRRKPAILTVEQFFLVLDLLPEPYRTMALIAQCSGLRVEEVLALYWSDIDFDELTVMVTRAVVHGRIARVKTEYSEDPLPLDSRFADVLRVWKTKSNGSELLFPSPVTGHCYHASPIQQDYIRRAGWCLVACPVCKAAPGTTCSMLLKGKGSLPKIPVHEERRALATKKKFGSIGWHTFRHTYRSWLDETGAPVGVQQKLMRHADIRTTMNQYGDSVMPAKRNANSKVVEMVFERKSSSGVGLPIAETGAIGARAS
jgi:integrase